MDARAHLGNFLQQPPAVAVDLDPRGVVETKPVNVIFLDQVANGIHQIIPHLDPPVVRPRPDAGVAQPAAGRIKIYVLARKPAEIARQAGFVEMVQHHVQPHRDAGLVTFVDEILQVGRRAVG